MEIINTISEFIANNLMGAAVGISVALEFILKYIPSKKPIGIIHAASGIIKSMGGLLNNLAEFLDKVAPQNIIDESKK